MLWACSVAHITHQALEATGSSVTLAGWPLLLHLYTDVEDIPPGLGSFPCSSLLPASPWNKCQSQMDLDRFRSVTQITPVFPRKLLIYESKDSWNPATLQVWCTRYDVVKLLHRMGMWLFKSKLFISNYVTFYFTVLPGLFFFFLLWPFIFVS